MHQPLNPWITQPRTPTAQNRTPRSCALPPAAVIRAPLRGMVEPDAADRLGHRT